MFMLAKLYKVQIQNQRRIKNFQSELYRLGCELWSSIMHRYPCKTHNKQHKTNLRTEKNQLRPHLNPKHKR